MKRLPQLPERLADLDLRISPGGPPMPGWETVDPNGRPVSSLDFSNDVLLIDFSKYSSNFSGPGGRGSVVLAFSMGAVAALLAGACVAPVVIQVVLFSSNLYATGTSAALALPFVLGLGMAIPWPIAGAGIAALPRPGSGSARTASRRSAAELPVMRIGFV